MSLSAVDSGGEERERFRLGANGGSGTLIAVRDVSKGYVRGGEQIRVLQDLNLSVETGDFLAFMGPSGSGKTTLLNLLGGLDVPSSGSITVAGDEITHLSGRRLTQWRARHVGFIFQMYNLIPVLPAFRNVELPLRLTRLSKSERKRHVETVLALVGLAYDSYTGRDPRSRRRSPRLGARHGRRPPEMARFDAVALAAGDRTVFRRPQETRRPSGVRRRPGAFRRRRYSKGRSRAHSRMSARSRCCAAWRGARCAARTTSRPTSRRAAWATSSPRRAGNSTSREHA